MNVVVLQAAKKSPELSFRAPAGAEGMADLFVP
jgi:hypothetical protein